MKILNTASLAITLVFMSLIANAELIPVLGGQAVYDTDLDITWLADANAGAGSAFDDGSDASDGRMTWDSANAWAADLTVDGHSNWRLPTAADPDATCTDDQAGSVPSSDPNGFNCTGSEMGHLFYDELSGTAGVSILSSGDLDLGLFTNIQGGPYWSSTQLTANPLGAWTFGFFLSGTFSGQQSASLKTDEKPAWAVHDGNIGGAAVSVAFTYTAEVTSTSGVLAGTVATGTIFTGIVDYHLNAVDVNTSSIVIGRYDDPIPPYLYMAGPPISFNAESNLQIIVTDRTGGSGIMDEVLFSGQNPANNPTTTNVRLQFIGANSILSSDAMPDFPALAQFSAMTFNLAHSTSGSVDGDIVGNITAITLIQDDADLDGVLDTDDNCILVPNGTLISDTGGNSQLDTNGDGFGNICDADFNNDLVINGLDVGPFVDGFGTSDADTDLNGDDVVNGLDVGPFVDMFGQAPGPSGVAP